VEHITSVIPIFAREPFIKKHDRVYAQLYCKICKEIGVILTPSWPAGDMYVPFTNSVCKSAGLPIPLLLHAAIYLELSLLRETSENAFSRETTEFKWYWVQCCMGGLLLWCTLSQFWVFFSEMSVVSAFILSALLFTMHLHVSCLFVLGNTFQATWYCAFVTSLVFQYLCLGWLCAFRGFFSWISCSKFISHFVESCLIFLFAPLPFTRNVKPYFSEGVVFCLVFWGPDADGRITLRWIFRKWEGVARTGRSWLRIGTGGGHLWVRWWTFGFKKCGEFLD